MGNRITIPEFLENDNNKNLVQEEIDNILDDFDFEKIHKVMEALGWVWEPIGSRVPTIAQLRKAARARLRDATSADPSYKDSVRIVSSGGFKATFEVFGAEWDERPFDDFFLGLEFVVEEQARFPALVL